MYFVHTTAVHQCVYSHILYVTRQPVILGPNTHSRPKKETEKENCLNLLQFSFWLSYKLYKLKAKITMIEHQISKMNTCYLVKKNLHTLHQVTNCSTNYIHPNGKYLNNNNNI